MSVRLLLVSILAFVLLGGCSNSDDIYQKMNEQELYERARTNLDKSNFVTAVKVLNILESRFPFGPYAEQSQLEIIYAYYKSFDFEEAIAAADRFIRLHPNHPKLDYAYYMRGLSAYSMDEGFLDRFVPTDNTKRDPGAARDAFNTFALLISRFPESDFAPDARARMVYLRNLLARFEINSANFYFERGAYMAAANRGKIVLENFPQTPAVPDALAVMVQAYRLLNMPDLANKNLALLKKHYPDHPSLDENGNFIDEFSNREKTWLEKLTFGLFGRKPPPEFDNRADYL